MGGDSFSAPADLSGPRIIKIERFAVSSFNVLVGEAMSNFFGDSDMNVPNGTELHWTLGGESICVPGAGLAGDGRAAIRVSAAPTAPE